MKILLEDDELIAVYRYLKKREEELSPSMRRILKRIEEELYKDLTIEQIEALNDD